MQRSQCPPFLSHSISSVASQASELTGTKKRGVKCDLYFHPKFYLIFLFFTLKFLILLTILTPVFLFLTISQILKYLNVDLKEVADLVVTEVVDAKSNPDIGMKERRIGLLFAAGAFVKSGRLPEALSRSATQAATLKLIVQFVSELSSSASLKQVPLMELTIETVLSLLSVVPKAQFQSHIHPIFSKLLSATSDELQPELLSLAMGLNKLFGYHLSTDNPQLWNRQETLFGVHNVRNLKLPLTVTVRTVPRIHKVWSHLLEALLAPSATQDADFSRFVEFILDALLKTDSTDHTYLTLHVAATFVSKLNASQLSTLLSAELLNTLFVHISRRKSVLYEPARNLVEALVFAGRQNSEISMAILQRLTSAYGDFNVLDHFVKPGIISTLTKSLDSTHLEQHIAFLLKEFATPNMPSDLVPKMEVVKTLTSSETKPSKKNKSSSMDVDEDSDNDVFAPNEDVELRAVHVDPTAWMIARQESIVSHLQRVALWTQSTHTEVVRKLVNNLFLFAFYTCTSMPSSSSQNSSSGSKTPSKKTKSSSSANTSSNAQNSLLLVLENVELDAKVRSTVSKTLLQLIDSLKVPSGDEEKNGKSDKNSGDSAASDKDANALKKKKHVQKVDESAFKHAHFWVWPVVQFEKSLLDDSQHFKPITGGKELDDIRSTAETLMARIEPVLKVSDETRRIRLEAFQSLLIHLHLLINVDLEDSIQSIQDLSRVFEELFVEKDETNSKSKSTPSSSAKKSSKDSNKMDTSENNEDNAVPEAIEVFTEILVALLLKASRSLRQVIEQNWLAFATLVNDKAFEIVTTALEEEQDAEDSDMDDEDDLEELGSDVELTLEGSGDGNDSEDDDAEDDSEGELEALAKLGSLGANYSDADSDSDSDVDGEEDETEKAFKEKLRAVLKEHGAYGGSDDEGEDSDGETNFDDAKMFELDAGLSKVIKEIEAVKQKSKRKRQNKMTALELQATEFRIRLLALVDLYIEQQTSFSLTSKQKETEAPAAVASQKKTPQKKSSVSAPSTPSQAPAKSRFHTTYLNAIWPLVRIVDEIASKKALAPLLNRVVASIHRLVKTRLPQYDTCPLTENQIESMGEILAHLYAGFNQPSKPEQVEIRVALIVYLQRLILDQYEKQTGKEAQKKQKEAFEKMRDGFRAAMKAYADASQKAIKTRAIYVDLFPQLLRRQPSLHLPLLVGVGDLIAKCHDGPMRASLTIAIFGTITRGVVESSTETKNDASSSSSNNDDKIKEESKNIIESVSFDTIINEFLKAFKTCFRVDSKSKSIHLRDLLIRATELFKISLAINKGDLKKCQTKWNHEELARFTAHVISSSATPVLPAVDSANNAFVHYLTHGKPKQTASKYGGIEEKMKAKQARREARKEKLASKSSSANSDKKKVSKDNTKKSSNAKMQISDDEDDVPAPKKDGNKKRKADQLSTPKSDASTPNKKKSAKK